MPIRRCRQSGLSEQFLKLLHAQDLAGDKFSVREQAVGGEGQGRAARILGRLPGAKAGEGDFDPLDKT
jgi:hypothetical protein